MTTITNETYLMIEGKLGLKKFIYKTPESKKKLITWERSYLIAIGEAWKLSQDG